MGKKDKEIKRLNRVIERLRRTNEQLSVDLHTLRRGTPAEKLATEIKYNLQDRTEALAMEGDTSASGEGFAAMFEKHHTEPLDGGVTKVFFTDHPDCGVKGLTFDPKPDKFTFEKDSNTANIWVEWTSDDIYYQARAHGKGIIEAVTQELSRRAEENGFAGIDLDTLTFDGRVARARVVRAVSSCSFSERRISEQLVCDVCESTDDVESYCRKCMDERC
jgi:hypothetical protein